ncbi:MAG: hypothetical protein HY889_02395 [Deltaproteobacteria bacterium]|nr:hypothetical protein [Deltaproteobacteria bacterium]
MSASSYISIGKIEAVVTDEEVNSHGKIGLINETALEAACMRTDFVKTLDGPKYIGSCHKKEFE